MIPVLISAVLLILGGVLSVFLKRQTAKIGLCMTVLASVVGLYGACPVLFGWRPAEGAVLQPVLFGMDSFSAMFLLPMYALAPVCALHAIDYVKERRNIFWFFFQMLLASMILVPVVDMGEPVPFLLAWELMGAFSFALVFFEYRKNGIGRDAWLYLLSIHAGAAFLIPMFLMREFAVFQNMHLFIFLLALLGFGMKSGFAFLHFWLPPSYSVSPSPVSVLMAGGMTNLGIYGLLRVISLMSLQTSWGWILLILGLCGSLGAIAFALAQTHLKRLIAYSSIENFGIMAMGFGFGFLAMNTGHPLIASGAISGAFLHLYNHSFLKGLLFLCAGAVHEGTGTYKTEQLGGLLKRMPLTGTAFLFGSTAISGIPPFNAFLSEFLLYAAALSGILASGNNPGLLIASILLVVTLALVGGVATAAFSRVAGIVFLGEPRSDCARYASEAPRATRIGILILMLCSLTVGGAAPWLIGCFSPAVRLLLKVPAETANSAGLLFRINGIGLILSILFILLAAGGKLLTRRRTVEQGPTWDCGYARPTARMQYTGSSYVAPLMNFFRGLLRPSENLNAPDELFPKQLSRSESTLDVTVARIWNPLFRGVACFASWIHRIQSGYLHLYIFFMVLAIVLMLVWAFLRKGI